MGLWTTTSPKPLAGAHAPGTMPMGIKTTTKTA